MSAHPDRPVVAGRFRKVRVLKSGQGVETLLARDLDRGIDGVVKTAPASGVARVRTPELDGSDPRR